MMPRSQIAALAVLLVGLGVVLVLVGDTGVSTGVFVAGQFTETPSPTIGPSPTPLPEGSAENWIAGNPGQYNYADPNVSAQIMYESSLLDELVASIGLEPPAEDDPYPLVNLLDQLRTQLDSQITDAQLTVEPDALTGPVIEIVDGTPVNTLRLRVGPQTPPTGVEFGGLDLVQMFIERPDEQVTLLQYVQRGEPSPVAYADFRAWLSENLPTLTGADAEATPEAESTLDPGATPEPTTIPEATEESTEATPAATEAVTPETTEEIDEPAPEATEAIEATPEGESTPGPEAMMTPVEKWMELSPGQVLYTPNAGAFIQYTAAPLAEFAQSAGVTIEGDQTPTVEDILNSVRTRLETQLAEGAITIEEGAFEGPVIEEINGIPFSYLHLTILPQAGAEGQEQPGQDMVMGLIQTGEDRITAIQFIFQGGPDTTVYDDFRVWLEENIVRLSELEVTAPAGPAATPTASGD